MLIPSTAPRDRFWRHVERPSPTTCWNWTGFKIRGYGKCNYKGYPQLAHRFAYEDLVGPVPDGLTLDHLCRNRACVNPAHLEPVTNRENCLRGESITAQNARKDVCLNGHPLTDDNLYQNRLPRRVCIICNRARAAAYKRAKIEARGPILPRTHCREWHLLSGENLMVVRIANRAPARRCRTCERARKRMLYRQARRDMRREW